MTTRTKQCDAIITKQTGSMFRQLIWIILISCVLICSYFIVLQQMQRFAITTVKINGQIVRTSKQEICDSIMPLLNKGFFGTNVIGVKDNLQKLPWVANAKVEKIWPDELSVTINEKTPVARWRGKGLVTTTGEIIYSEMVSDLDKLPMFWGKDTQVKQVLENYLTISKALSKDLMSVNEIEIMPDHGVRAILNNGIMIFLGREGLLARLNRFTLAYRNKLQQMSHKINYVDLRYVNGIAIGWKDSISSLYVDKFFNEDYTINV